jgi:hypothetical protein
LKDWKKERQGFRSSEKVFTPRPLARDPFSWGTPVSKEPNWKYGFYFVGSSDAIGKFPSFDVAYRVTDDTVYLLDIGAIKF